MLVDHKSQAVDTSGVQSVQFGIEGSALIYKLMYSTMFQDKEKVVLQELAANALDAHRSAGKADVPIRIVLPTEMSPELVIEDEGIGMSHDTVCNVYPVYGRSLKSDNNTDIGGFGYGGKSPFSISESYTVETTHKGVTTTVACYLDNGYPKFSVFTTGEVGKPDGTVVRVPVADKQKQNTLKNKAEGLFILWDVKPKFGGYPIDYSKDFKLYESQNLIVFDTRAGIYNYGNSSTMIRKVAVGPYLYNIPDSMLDKIRSTNEDYAFLNRTSRTPVEYHVVYKFNIGEIELSPSREWIEDTSANIAALIAATATEARIVRNTATPVGVAWYEAIHETVKTHGLWSNDLLPNYSLNNVPFGIDPAHITAKLKELRGTVVNPLTNNYDSNVVWAEVTRQIQNDPVLVKKYYFSAAQVPSKATSLLDVCNIYEDVNGSQERVPYAGYVTLPSKRESMYNDVLRSMIGLLSPGASFRKIDNGKVRSLRHEYYGQPFERLELNVFNRSSEIVLSPDGVSKEVSAYLRYQPFGRYLVVTVDEETIGHIKTFTEKYAAFNTSAYQPRIAFPDQIQAAYAKYKDELKARAKARVVNSGPRSSDVVVGRIYDNITDDTYGVLTKNTLLEHKFDEKGVQYIIAKRHVKYSRSSGDEKSILSYSLQNKYSEHLKNIRVLVITDQSKIKTEWWTKFEATLEQFPQVTVLNNVGYGSTELGNFVLAQPNIVALDALIDTWKTYLAVFDSSGAKYLLPYIALLHGMSSASTEYLSNQVEYSIRVTPKSSSIKLALFNDPLAKSAYAKLIAANRENDNSFVRLISDDEKAAYLKVINTHLNIDKEVDNDSEHPNT